MQEAAQREQVAEPGDAEKLFAGQGRQEPPDNAYSPLWQSLQALSVPDPAGDDVPAGQLGHGDPFDEYSPGLHWKQVLPP